MSQETVIVRLPTARIRARKVSAAKSPASKGKTVDVPPQGLASLVFYICCAVGLAVWDGILGLASRLARKAVSVFKQR